MHTSNELRGVFEMLARDEDFIEGYPLALPADGPGYLNPRRWVLGRLWHCTDIMPGDLCDDLDLPRGSSYACGAQLVAKLDRDT